MTTATTGSQVRTLGHVLHSNWCVALPVPEPTPTISEQTIIVTGSNMGLGYEASRHLLRIGVGKLIMGVRSVDKGKAARETLLRDTQRDADAVEVWEVDMADYESVKRFGKRANSLPRLDAVIANAGLATESFRKAEDNEITLTVNVVSTLLLFLLVLPILRQAPSGGRFTIPNSALQFIAPITELAQAHEKDHVSIFDRLNDGDQADMAGRYPLSKLLIVYAVRDFAARMEAAGINTVALNTPNPSFCKSGLTRENDTIAARLLTKVGARSTEMGSRALVHGVLLGMESNGKYTDNCHIAEPATTVTSPQGVRLQEAFCLELKDKLEAILPGIYGNIQS